jgi:histidine triad (HIT) family protein
MEFKYDKENIFAKILRKEIPNNTVIETDFSLAFKDINPVAPVHILVIPKGPYVNYDHFVSNASNEEILDFNNTVKEVIKKFDLDPERNGNGYRLIANTGLNGVQEVPHLHFHILGGRNMGFMVARP